MFSVVCDKDIKPESIKPGEKIYLDTSHFLPFSRFIQKKEKKVRIKVEIKIKKEKVETLIEGEKVEKEEEDHKEVQVVIDRLEVEVQEDIDLLENKESNSYSSNIYNLIKIKNNL